VLLERAYTEHLGTFRCTYPGAKGTDLGISFVQSGRVVFLFGDTMADDPRLQDVDLAATAPLVLDRAVAPELAWLGALAPPGLPLGRMGVPTDGVAVGDDTYVFFATRFDERTQTYGTSALARTRGLALDRLELVHEAPAGDFANVSVVVEGDEAFVFGTGAYRRSAIRLARVPLARLADRAAWAIAPDPVVDVACAGELSVRKHPRLPLYLLAYNASEPRGIALWLADHPAGPWRSAGLLYAPGDGYERFIHAKESAVGHDDGLSQPGDEATWGGEYGPYFVPSWFEEDGGALGIVFTLSSWNPYQVHLVRTWLVPPGVARVRPLRGVGLPPPELASDGTFTVAASTRAIAFALAPRRFRREATVTLVRGADVVRASRSSRWRRRVVRWDLEAYRGETLQLDVGAAAVEGITFL
jgi:hypothetical protein